MNMRLSVRSKPSSVVAAWTRAGAIAGACLAGMVNGIVLAALARPTGLDLGRRAARIRAAAITGLTTELLFLPLQHMNVNTLPLHIWNLLILPPTIASVRTAALIGLRLPPAGRLADRDALVRIH
jgi:hypothetical protein